MNVFFDTSAVVPLLIEETTTDQLRQIWEGVSVAYAWSWMRGEAEAALVRRKADAQAWQVWRIVQAQVRFLVLDPELESTLRAFNRSLGLRAADAGHLFVLDRLLTEESDVRLLTCDREMMTAAQRLGFPVFKL